MCQPFFEKTVAVIIKIRMMKKLFLYTMLIASVSIYSCGNSDNTAVKSTPIDSSNANGAAPVQYGTKDSGGMLPDENKGDGNRVNTPDGDSLPMPNR